MLYKNNSKYFKSSCFAISPQRKSITTELSVLSFNANIEYILSAKRFEEPFFQWKRKVFKQGYESVNSVFIAVDTCITCRFLILFS